MIRGQALPLGASVTDRDGANEIIAAVSDVLTDDEVCVNAV